MAVVRVHLHTLLANTRGQLHKEQISLFKVLKRLLVMMQLINSNSRKLKQADRQAQNQSTWPTKINRKIKVLSLQIKSHQQAK